MRYYYSTFFMLGFLFVAGIALFAASYKWASGQRMTLTSLNAQRLVKAKELQEASASIEAMQTRNIAPSQFLAAWAPHMNVKPASDIGNYLRSELGAEAIRLGITSEGATVSPALANYQLGDRKVKVQTVSIRVVDQSLNAVLTWLGQVENRFPFARVESVSVSSYGSASVQLTTTLAYWVDANKS